MRRPLTSLNPDVRILPDAPAVASAAARLLADSAAEAVRVTGRFAVALSGGSTPAALFAELRSARWASQVAWAAIHLFWGDERCVPPDHPDSNFRLAARELLEHVPIPTAQVHRIRGEEDPRHAAREYDNLLRAFVAERPGTATGLDLVVLGLGEDGHTASLFPGTEAVREATDDAQRSFVPAEGPAGRGQDTPWVSANYVPRLNSWRVTLMPRAINSAGLVAFLVTGAAKADSLARVLACSGDDAAYPARLVRPSRGRLVWLVDEAAAAGLHP